MTEKLKYGSPAFSTALSATAERIAKRVKNKVGVPILTIITIVTTVLPLLAKLPCFGGDEKPTPEQTRKAVAEKMKRNPLRTVRQTAVKIRSSARQKNHAKISLEESREIAQASIDDCLARDDETVSSFVAACAGVVDDVE